MLALWTCLLEVAFPEHCVLCGRAREDRAWCAAGPHVAGVRRADRPHLCGECRLSLFTPGAGVHRALEGPRGEFPVLAAAATGEALTRVVGAWKYGGVRGLAWPLAEALGAVVALPGSLDLAGAALIPVPLHGRRARARGFNQAALLARLLGLRFDLPVLAGVARRVRRTHQQARIADWQARGRNMSSAFRAWTRAGKEAPEIILVDDLITSGATVLALATSLEERGWRVRGGLALGVARPRPDSE